MPERSPDSSWRGHRRRYSPGSEHDRPRKDRGERRRSPEQHGTFDREDEAVKDTSRSEPRRRRSRSPRDERTRARRRYSSDNLSPERRPRSHRDEDRRHSRKERSTSRSPPPEQRRHDSREDQRRSSHHHSYRKPALSRPRSLSPPVASPPIKRSTAPLPSQEAAYNKEPTSTAVTKPPPDVEKQKPNFAPTGKLAAETNTVANTSIVLKYNEPPEARLPPASSPWLLYIFKGPDILETLPLHERSCWLFGRERAVVDFPTEHPSCSKQHAVLQFRYTERKNEWGERKGGVKPYVIDLESANGTKVNGEKVPERRYMEVKSGDVITFGESTREYVILVPPKEEKKS